MLLEESSNILHTEYIVYTATPWTSSLPQHWTIHHIAVTTVLRSCRRARLPETCWADSKINKTVIVASIGLLYYSHTLMMHGQTQVKFIILLSALISWGRPGRKKNINDSRCLDRESKTKPFKYKYTALGFSETLLGPSHFIACSSLGYRKLVFFRAESSMQAQYPWDMLFNTGKPPCSKTNLTTCKLSDLQWKSVKICKVSKG